MAYRGLNSIVISEPVRGGPLAAVPLATALSTTVSRWVGGNFFNLCLGRISLLHMLIASPFLLGIHHTICWRVSTMKRNMRIAPLCISNSRLRTICASCLQDLLELGSA